MAPENTLTLCFDVFIFKQKQKSSTKKYLCTIVTANKKIISKFKGNQKYQVS